MVPLLIISPSNKTTEAAIKYFLPQAIASVILIASFIINYSNAGLLSLSAFNTLVSAALLIKLGIAPLHFWFPQVLIKAP
jgi:NADH-ubiquinone oxidoreductase chain 2